MPKQFQKRVEDFVCEHCGAAVRGSGYTNHCPQCLWSKHVDVNPGDRAADCGALMKPVACEKEGQEYVLTYECHACGHKKRNKVQESDNFDTLLKIATN